MNFFFFLQILHSISATTFLYLLVWQSEHQMHWLNKLFSSKIIDVQQSSLSVLYTSQVAKMANSILSNHTHPLNQEFQSLLSGTHQILLRKNQRRTLIHPCSHYAP